MKDTASLPSWASASCIAASEPRASPSGCSCVQSTNRSPESRMSTTSVIGVPEQALDPFRAVSRVVIAEVELRRVLQAQLVRDGALERTVRRLEARQRELALVLVTQHGHPDGGVTEIGRRVDG